MNSKSYLEDFLDPDELPPTGLKATHPDWVSDSNSSQAAYMAIQELYSQKLHFIKTHNKKTQFTKEFSIKISQTSVAQAVGKSPNALFNSVNYASKLREELKRKNDILLSAKENVLAVYYSGNQRKTKKELVKSLQSVEEKNIELNLKTYEEVLERAIQRLPLPIRRKLGLD